MYMNLVLISFYFCRIFVSSKHDTHIFEYMLCIICQNQKIFTVAIYQLTHKGYISCLR